MDTSKKTNSLLCLLKDEIELNIPLAIGTLQWGTTWVDDKIINSNGCLTEETCQDIVNVLNTANVTLYDTAEGYGGGTSELRLGRLLSSSSSNNNNNKDNDNNKNKKIIFMTKFLPAPWRLFHIDLERAVRASCKRLNVDCIPIYLLHSPVHWYRPIEYWIEACAICYKKGLIKAMGLSNCNAEQVERAVMIGNKYGIPVVCNQVHYSLLDYNSIELQKMEKVCNKLNVKIIAFSPIGQGLLTDNLTTEKFKTIKPVRMLRLQWDDIQPLRTIIQEMSTKYNKTMAQIALNWCIQHNVIPLVGCRSTKQAIDSIGCLHWSLSKDDVIKLDHVALARSTLESPPWRRMLFVSLFAIVMVVCRTLDSLGFSSVVISSNNNKTD